MQNPINYLRETIAELKLVRWPTRAETTKLTTIVIVISLLVAAYVGGLDVLLTNTVTWLINR